MRNFFCHSRHTARENRLLCKKNNRLKQAPVDPDEPNEGPKADPFERLEAKIKKLEQRLAKMRSEQAGELPRTETVTPREAEVLSAALSNNNNQEKFAEVVVETGVSTPEAFDTVQATVRNRRRQRQERRRLQKKPAQQVSSQVELPPHIPENQVQIWQGLSRMMSTGEQVTTAASILSDPAYTSLTLEEFVQTNPESPAVSALSAIQTDFLGIQQALLQKATNPEVRSEIQAIMQGGLPNTVQEFLQFVELTRAYIGRRPAQAPKVNPDQLRAELKMLRDLREKLEYSRIDIGLMQNFDDQFPQAIRQGYGNYSTLPGGYGSGFGLGNTGFVNTGFTQYKDRAVMLIQQRMAIVDREISVRENKLRSMGEPFGEEDVQASATKLGVPNIQPPQPQARDYGTPRAVQQEYPSGVTPLAENSMREDEKPKPATTEFGRLANHIREMVIPGRYKTPYTPPAEAKRYDGTYDIESARSLDHVLQLIPVSDTTKFHFKVFLSPLVVRMERESYRPTIAQLTSAPGFQDFRKSLMRDVSEGIKGIRDAAKQRYILNTISSQLNTEDPKKLMNFIWRLQDTWTGADQSPSNQAWQSQVASMERRGYVATNPYPETPHYRYMIKRDLSYLPPERRALAAKVLGQQYGVDFTPDTSSASGSTRPASSGSGSISLEQRMYRSNRDDNPDVLHAQYADVWDLPQTQEVTRRLYESEEYNGAVDPDPAEVAYQRSLARTRLENIRRAQSQLRTQAEIGGPVLKSVSIEGGMNIYLPEEYRGSLPESYDLRINVQAPRSQGNGIFFDKLSPELARVAGIRIRPVSIGGRPSYNVVEFTKPGLFIVNGKLEPVGDVSAAEMEAKQEQMNPANALASTVVSFGKYKPRIISLTLPDGTQTTVNPAAARKAGDRIMAPGNIVVERIGGRNYDYQLYFFDSGQYDLVGFYDRGGGRAFGGSIDVSDREDNYAPRVVKAPAEPVPTEPIPVPPPSTPPPAPAEPAPEPESGPAIGDLAFSNLHEALHAHMGSRLIEEFTKKGLVVKRDGDAYTFKVAGRDVAYVLINEGELVLKKNKDDTESDTFSLEGQTLNTVRAYLGPYIGKRHAEVEQQIVNESKSPEELASELKQNLEAALSMSLEVEFDGKKLMVRRTNVEPAVQKEFQVYDKMITEGDHVIGITGENLYQSVKTVETYLKTHPEKLKTEAELLDF